MGGGGSLEIVGGPKNEVIHNEYNLDNWWFRALKTIVNFWGPPTIGG